MTFTGGPFAPLASPRPRPEVEPHPDLWCHRCKQNSGYILGNSSRSAAVRCSVCRKRWMRLIEKRPKR